ncbi:MAG: hypothetical protein EBT95_06080 [Verrucomicrobia bacterium]|nr:hypothetical protein [Verrucomicrobiota bacterium]
MGTDGSRCQGKGFCRGQNPVGGGAAKGGGRGVAEAGDELGAGPAGEAIEVAKALSTEESGRFVNGVLDKARASLGRPERTITKATT